MKEKSTSGVSETIGFMLILSLVITGIALVTLFGYPLLLKEQANANIRNMEKGMIVLQNDIKSLAYKNVPYKETTLQVKGGSLSINSAETLPLFTISANTPQPIDAKYTPFIPGELIYLPDSGDSIVMLENGAVIMRQWSAEGSTMLAEPRWFYDDSTSERTLVIPLVKLYSPGDQARTGVGTIQMKITETDSAEYEVTDKEVTVTYIPDSENDHRTAWYNYFVNTLQFQDLGSGSYKKTGVDRLVIKKYNITVLSL